MTSQGAAGSSLFTRLKEEVKKELRAELLIELRREAQQHVSTLHSRADKLDSDLQAANEQVLHSAAAVERAFGLLRLYDDEHSALLQTHKEMQVRFRDTEAAIFTLFDKLTGVVDNNQKSIERQEQNQLEVAADVKYISDRFKLLFNKTMAANKTFGSLVPRGSVLAKGDTSSAVLGSGLGSMGDFLDGSSAKAGVEKKSSSRRKLSSFDDALEEGSDEDEAGRAGERASSSAVQALEKKVEQLHASGAERIAALAAAVAELRASAAALSRGLAEAGERDALGTPEGLQRLKRALARADMSQNADMAEVRGDIELLKRRLLAVAQTVKHYSAPNAAHGAALPVQSHILEVQRGGGEEADGVLRGRVLVPERRETWQPLPSTDMAEGPQPPVKGSSQPLSARAKRAASYAPALPQRRVAARDARDVVITSRASDAGKSVCGSEGSAASQDSRRYQRLLQDVERLKSHYSGRRGAGALMADFEDGRRNLLDDDCPDSVSEITFR